MLLTADTQEQLDRETKALLSAAEGKMCQMAVLKFQQLDGLNTVLPIGPRKLSTRKRQRPSTSTSSIRTRRR